MNPVISLAGVAIIATAVLLWLCRNDSDVGLYEVASASSPDIDGDGIPGDISWRSGDIAVFVDPGIDSRYGFLVASVVREIQDAVGPGVLRDPIKSDARMPHTIYINDDGGKHPGYGSAEISRASDGGILDVEVYLPLQALSTGQAHTVTRHEILHALGLSHSTSRQSVMYPVVTAEQYITPQDIEMLRKIFQKGE